MTKQNVALSEAVAAMFPTRPPRAGPAVSHGDYAIRKKYLKQLELDIAGPGGVEGMIESWVEAMKAASPTHAKAVPAPAPPTSEERPGWMARHPSALDVFEEIVEASKGKQIVMFLDYDGTLSPIVQDPDRAFMSEQMREAVKDVARYFPAAIVSGRCIDKVYSFVRLAELYYAGSHGMDIKGPRNNKEAREVLFQPASQFLPMIDEVYHILVEKIKSVQGARVENNKFCLSVHFRCVDEKKWDGLEQQVRSVLRDYPKLRLTQGRKVGLSPRYMTRLGPRASRLEHMNPTDMVFDGRCRCWRSVHPSSGTRARRWSSSWTHSVSGILMRSCPSTSAMIAPMRTRSRCCVTEDRGSESSSPRSRRKPVPPTRCRTHLR